MMMKPTVHLNGTSRGALREAYEDAVNALGKANRSVQFAAPNARDYYPQGHGAYQQAAQEHVDRLDRLEAVRAELIDILMVVEGDET